MQIALLQQCGWMKCKSRAVIHVFKRPAVVFVGSKVTEITTKQVASLLRASEYSSPTALNYAPKVTPREA